MADCPKFGGDSSAVQTHLSILQGIIGRMTANSASSKTSCLVSVAAAIVALAVSDKLSWIPIAIIPTILFLILDIYYLAQERSFRHSYNDFVDKLHKHGKVDLLDLYKVAPGRKELVVSLSSFAIWPFYGTLFVLILVIFVSNLLSISKVTAFLFFLLYLLASLVR